MKTGKELRFIGLPNEESLPIKPIVNSIYITKKNGNEYKIFPVDSQGNYLKASYLTSEDITVNLKTSNW